MPIGPNPHGAGGGGGAVGPNPHVGGGGGGSKAAAPPKKTNWIERILGSRESGKKVAKEYVVGPQGLVNTLSVLSRPLEAVQGLAGASNLTTGEEDGGALATLRASLLEGDQYGIRGKGALNTAANFGLDLIDPTIAFSAGTKAARFGSRALVEQGAKDLAMEAAARGGLSEAGQAAARPILARHIAEGGAGDLAKRSVLDKVARRHVGLEGSELATERMLTGLVKEGQGGVRLAGKTVLSGDTMKAAGDVLRRRVPGLGVADETARTLFTPRAGVKRAIGRDEADALYNARSAEAGAINTHTGDNVRPLERLIKDNKVTTAELEGPLRALMEEGTALPADVSARLQPVADNLIAMRAATDARIVGTKLLPGEYKHTTSGYLHRRYTDDFFQLAAQAQRNGRLPQELANVLKVDGALEARKILPDAPIPVVEAYVRQLFTDAGIKVELKKGHHLIDHNAAVATLSHSVAVERAAQAGTVLDTLAALPGGLVRMVDTPTVPAGPLDYKGDMAKIKSRKANAKKRLARLEGKVSEAGPMRQRSTKTDPPGLINHTVDPVRRLALDQQIANVKSDILALDDEADALVYRRDEGGAINAANDAARRAPEGYEKITVGERTAYVHPDIAREINPLKRLVDSNASVQKTAHHIDAVQNFWRAQVTVLPISTGFFGRNGQGNLIFNMVDNVGLRDYKRSLHIQRGVRRARKTGVEPEAILNAADAKMFRQAEQKNVYNQGAQEADLDNVFPEDKVSGVKHYLDPRGKGLPVIGTGRAPIKAGRALNASIENNARLANFIANTRHTGHYAEAARRTRITMLDYGDLTPFEREVGRRVMPFYTFAKKSTEQLLREMAHDPAKLNRITGLIEAFEAETGRNIDSPFEAGGKTLTKLIGAPGEFIKSELGVGGYLGAAKGQAIGTLVPDKDTGGTYAIEPGTGSENRFDMLATSILPLWGKYGRATRAYQQLAPGEKQDLLRAFLGLSPQEQAAYREGHKRVA